MVIPQINKHRAISEIRQNQDSYFLPTEEIIRWLERSKNSLRFIKRTENDTSGYLAPCDRVVSEIKGAYKVSDR